MPVFLHAVERAKGRVVQHGFVRLSERTSHLAIQFVRVGAEPAEQCVQQILDITGVVTTDQPEFLIPTAC